MKLRARLLLTALLIGVPVVVAVRAGYRMVSLRRADDSIAMAAVARLSARRSDCEAQPWVRKPIELQATRGSPLSPLANSIHLEVSTYDAMGVSAAAGAPLLPASLFSELGGDTVVAGHASRSEGRELVVALPWKDGVCALALVETVGARASGPPIPLLLAPLLLVIAALLVGMGPVVRRARVLTEEVRRWQGDLQLLPTASHAKDELGELSRAFRGAAEAARQQHEALTARERDLREFVENVSHDLATPLTVMQGHLAALEKEWRPEVAREAMNEAQYLGALLGSLAVDAKVDVGGNVSEDVDLGAIVERVIGRHRGIASRSGVSLEAGIPDVPIVAKADPTFTEQALTNLVGNALRYQRSGGHVAVVLDVSPGAFCLRVLDDGPGLSDEDMDRVLRRGERGDVARGRDEGGRGLGLHIVSRVAALQGWNFSLATREGGGLVAELRGPRLDATPQRSSSAP